MVALQACCMCVARMRTAWLACPVCMCVVPKQWWKQCKVDKYQSSSHAIPHASASCLVHRWKAIANGLPVNQRPSNVPITEGNVLKYAARAYFKTLLKNYTTQALGAHVLWTIRYLATAAGWDWGPLRHHLTSTLRKKDTTVAQCLQALVDVGCDHPVRMVATVRELLERWDAVAGSAAQYHEHTTSSAALHLRCWCLSLLKFVQAQHPGGIQITVTKSRGGTEVREQIVVHPKLFKLTPICNRSAPFITLDNLWARKVLGLKGSTVGVPAHGPCDPDEMEFEDGGMVEIPVATLKPFMPLNFIFGQASVVKRWFKKGVPFPATVRTDGVQLHVPIELERVVPEDVADALAASQRECKSKSPHALAQQLGRNDGHGEFAEVAVASLPGPRPHPGAAARPSVGVDPGLISIAAASNGVEVPSSQFYHGRLQRPRRTFDPGGARDPEDISRTGHSRRSRNNCTPRAVVDGETALSNTPPGVTLTDFVDHLAVYFQHEESQRRWYGSRTQRSARFVRAGRTRAIFASIINRIAPDPRTVIVFGSYSGRGCMRGDTRGPSPIKALRRAMARHRILIVVDEYKTTITHSACGEYLIQRANDPTGREKYCPICQVDVPRDVDAGCSIKSIFDSVVATGQRPAHLRRG